MDLDLRDLPGRPVERVLPRCPRCHSSDLAPVSDGETVHFLCADCGRCWNVEFNWVQRVDPATCPGCPARSRCAAIYLTDHPEAARLASGS
jgi:hypothetical protein